MVFQATGGAYPLHPTYFQGRYSNGQVWIEYLIELGLAKTTVCKIVCVGQLLA